MNKGMILSIISSIVMIGSTYFGFIHPDFIYQEFLRNFVLFTIFINAFLVCILILALVLVERQIYDVNRMNRSKSNEIKYNRNVMLFTSIVVAIMLGIYSIKLYLVYMVITCTRFYVISKLEKI